MPTDSIMPIMVSTLSVSPVKYMAASVTTSEEGTARLTSRVVGTSRKNTNSTTKASPAPISPAERSSDNDDMMDCAWLPTTRKRTPRSCGVAFAFSNSARTRLATSMTFAWVVL